MRSIVKKALLICSVTTLFVGCGGGGGSETTDTNTTADYTDFVLTKALNIDTMQIDTATNTTQSIGDSLASMDRMLLSMTDILQSNTETLTDGMNLLEMMAREFAIDSNYSDTFSYNPDYTDTIPPISVTKILDEDYFLLLSTNRFYTEGTTIKKFFNSAVGLGSAWNESMQVADPTKDLYMKIIRVGSDGSTYNVTNSLWIKNR